MTAPTPDLAELRGKDLARWCPATLALAEACRYVELGEADA